MPKILIVDDDPEFVAATQALLEAEGYTVLTAENGEQGYAAAKREKPNLMLLDVMMTHASEGFDTARKLKDDPATQKLPVIMVTGIRKAMTLPFRYEPDDDWLPVKAVVEKPVKPEELLRLVKKALA
ncbi:MAG: response regulator [Kiritimatiellae bacterium]|nr:response regulator [Kiritimatiellia bacterium]